MRIEYIIDQLRTGDKTAKEIASTYCEEHPSEEYWTVLNSTKNKLSKLHTQQFVEKKKQVTIIIPSTHIFNKNVTNAKVKVWLWGLVQ